MSRKTSNHFDDTFFWLERDRIQDLDVIAEHEELFLSDFRSWNRGDCTEAGLLLIYVKYLFGETDNFHNDVDVIKLNNNIEAIRKDLS